METVQYQSANFTWIDRTVNTTGTTYYYCVVARSSTLKEGSNLWSVSIPIGQKV